MVSKERKVPLGNLDTYNSSSFKGYYEKMADVDIDPLGNHNESDSHPDEGENIPLTPGGRAIGESTCNPEPEQETSFGGTSLKGEEVLKECIKGLYQKLSESIGQTPKELHYDYFEIRDGRLYHEDITGL